MEKSTSVRWNTDNKHQIKNWLTAKETSKFYLSPILGIDPNLEGLNKLSHGIVLTKLIPREMAKQKTIQEWKNKLKN